MRRALATATLGLAFFATAACADTPMDPTGSPTPGKSATVADKKATCDAYKKLDTETTAKAAPFGMKLADPSKITAEDIAAMVKIVTDYQAELKTIAAGASDAEVKAAIQAEIADNDKVLPQLLATGNDPAKAIAIMQQADDKLSEKVKTLCGA